MFDEQVWKDIIGYEGLYQISNFGNVINVKTKKPLKGKKDKKGYLCVVLYSNGKRKEHKRHRLVALNFIPNPFNKPEVNHKDGDKANNYVDNLEWATTKENINHAVQHNLINDRKGESHNLSKLKNADVLEIANLLKEGYKPVTVAKMFMVDRTTVSNIKHGKTWSHLTGITKTHKI